MKASPANANAIKPLEVTMPSQPSVKVQVSLLQVMREPSAAEKSLRAMLKRDVIQGLHSHGFCVAHACGIYPA